MKATGSSTERTIWNFLIVKGMSPAGAAGLMGNLYAESGLDPQNLQNSYEKRLGFTNATYTAAVDSGSYSNFVRDSAGYGLAQWTYWSRKEALLNFARKTGASIGSLEMQLDFMIQELKGYVAVWEVLRTARTVKEASDIVLTKYERPADMGSSVKAKRASYGQAYFDAYANKTTEKEESTMSNSPLVSYTNITKNRTSPRNHAIDTITIHCIVGQWTAKQGCDYFATTDRECSANYVVGKDGSIGLSVPEADRSWCSSNRANDHRAITIEVASGTSHPYAVTDAAYAALIELVADICKRNGIKKLLWKADKSLVGQVDKQNMTVHRWFANKSCPGDYLYERHSAIAEAVNAKLGADTTQDTGSDDSGSQAATDYPATPFLVRVIIDDLNYRKGPGMSYAVNGQTGKGTFTIVEVQDGWGKLKSGAGWIYLENESYCTIVGDGAPAETWTPAVGDIVNFSGSRHYASANAAKGSACTGGRAKITQIYKPGKSKHPYHLVRVSGSGSTVYGWVDAGTFTKA